MISDNLSGMNDITQPRNFEGPRNELTSAPYNIDDDNDDNDADDDELLLAELTKQGILTVNQSKYNKHLQ